MRNCTLITGPVNSGKTSLLRRIMRETPESDRRTGGVIAVPLYRNGGKYGFDIMDIHSGNMVPLVRSRDMYMHVSHDEIQVTGRFLLFKRGLSFACDALARAACGDANSPYPCDVICVDEVGPLEKNGKGYAAVLDSVLRNFSGDLYIVSRSETAAWLREKCLENKWNITVIQPGKRAE